MSARCRGHDRGGGRGGDGSHGRLLRSLHRLFGGRTDEVPIGDRCKPVLAPLERGFVEMSGEQAGRVGHRDHKGHVRIDGGRVAEYRIAKSVEQFALRPRVDGGIDLGA